MENALFSRNSRELLRLVVLYAAETSGYDLEKGLGSCSAAEGLPVNSEELPTAFDACFKSIEWESRESILPFVPMFEEAYTLSPNHFGGVRKKLDESLARDGYRMKDGRLVRLKHRGAPC